MAILNDLIVSGASRFVGPVKGNAIQMDILKVPTTNGGAEYGPGANGQVLKSNGSSVYWGIDAGYTHPTFTAQSQGLYKITVNNEGHVTGVAPVTKADITGLGIPGSDTNTDTKVTQTVTTENLTYPLLLAPNGQTTNTTTTSYFDSGVTLNPSTNTIAANISGNAATATSATKATQDGNGNTITSKYVTLDTTQTISGAKTFSSAPTAAYYITNKTVVATPDGTAEGWYRCATFTAGSGTSNNFILSIRRSYYSPENEGYLFSISNAYTSVNITQLNGSIGGHLLTKIRVNIDENRNIHVDYYMKSNGVASYKNGWYISGFGDGTVYTPYLVSSYTGTVTEFETVEGLKNNIGYIGNATTATTADKTKAALTLNGKTFNGSTAVNMGVLSPTYGGTGKTTLIDASNALLNALSTGSSTPTDADYYISQYVGGGTTTTTYHRRPMSALWSYIQGKSDSRYVNVSGDTMSGVLNAHGGITLNSSTAQGTLQYILGIKAFADGGNIIWQAASDVTVGKANALTVNAGNAGQPVYFTGGVPTAIDWHIGNSGVGEHNCNNVTYNFSGYYTANGPATSLGPTTNDGALWAQAYSSSWVAQMAQDYRDGSLYVRGRNSGTWTAWQNVILGNGYQNVGPIKLTPGEGANNITTNYISAGRGYSTGSGLNGLKLVATEQNDAISGIGQDCTGKAYELSIAAAMGTSGQGYITFVGHKIASLSTYSELGHFNFANSTFYVNGKIGVGTTSPSYAVHAVGDVYANGGWLRSSGDTGWYNQSYDGGWYMTDSTYVRSYNSKALYINNSIYVGTTAGGGTGLSLYGTSAPTLYGIHMSTTANYGKHGDVQSDWATYFNMNAVSQRGWIYRAGSTNVASISANGIGFFNGLITSNRSNSAGSYTNTGLEIREYNYSGTGADSWGQAPRLSFHWSGRNAAQIGLASNGYLYTAPSAGTTFYKLVYESGTWGISISGNAATASALQGAASSGSVPLTDPGAGVLKYYYNVNNGLTGNMPTTNNANGILYLNTHSGEYGYQLGFSSNGNIYYRHKNGSAFTASTAWKTILDSGNYADFTDDRYVNVSGDTMTGKLQVNDVIVGYSYTKNGSNHAAFIFDKPSSNWTGIGACSESDTIYFGACDANGAWVTSYRQKWKFNGSLVVGGGDDNCNIVPWTNNYSTIGTESLKWWKIYASTFYGNLNGTATNATNDANGNNIVSTYLPLSGGTITGNINFASNTSTTSPTGQRIVINGIQNDTTVANAPGIGFHIPNVTWGNLKFCSDGSFRFYNNSCSAFMPIYASKLNVEAPSGSVMVSVKNDASGKINLQVNDSGNKGIYDNTNSKWIIYSGSDNITKVPSNQTVSTAAVRNIKILAPGTSVTPGTTAMTTGEVWMRYE